MRLNQVLNLKKWQRRKISVGYGTRDKTVLKKTKKGRVYFLIKTYDKDIGELRSEVCASNIGRLFGFPVQKTWLCNIARHKRLGLRHPVGVAIQLDVRRQKETRRGRFREDLIHGADLISLIDKNFALMKNLKGKRKVYTLKLVIKAISNYVAKHPEAQILWEQFFNLLCFDALIGGTDRHYYNWGVLEMADGGKFLRLAPAFDNGVSLMWKLEEYKAAFMKDLMFGNFPKRAQSMFKKVGGGKFTLYEVLKELYKEDPYKNSGIAQKVLSRISNTKESRIRSVIMNNIPLRKKFRTEEHKLEVVALYAIMRLRILRETLGKIVTNEAFTL